MTALFASIPSPATNVIEIGPLTIHFYGILIAIGVIVAVIVSKRRYERFGGDGTLLERVAIWAVVIGFLGARAGYVTTHTARFEGRPWAVLYIWEGGLALFGGILFGTLTVIYLMHRWKGDLFSAGDAIAVGLPLAQAIGRWGNYFNQELFGTPTDLPWGLEIDVANRPDAYLAYDTFHPTFLYESLWNALVLVPVILVLERRGKLAKGATFPVYLIMYGFIRFVMELMRTDTTFRLLGLSRNGWVSIGAVLVVVGFLVWMQRRAEKRTYVGEPTWLAPAPDEDTELVSIAAPSAGIPASDEGLDPADRLGPAEDPDPAASEPSDG